MYCKNCGKQIDDSSRFCIYCGCRLDSQKAEELSAREEPRRDEKEPRNDEKFAAPLAGAQRYCTHCGHPISGSAEVCVHCGYKTGQSSPPSSKTSYCVHCGKPIESGAFICVHCGKRVNVPHKPNMYAIVSIILSVLGIGFGVFNLISAVLAPVSLIVSLKTNDVKSLRLGIVAIVLCAFVCVLSIIIGLQYVPLEDPII